MDLILGGFADAHIGDLGDHDLADFEALMDVPDDELFTWVTGRAQPEEKYLSPVFRSIVAFHTKGETAGETAGHAGGPAKAQMRDDDHED